MPVRSDLLALSQRGAGTFIEYTTAAGITAIVKDIRLSVHGGALSTAAVQLQRLGAAQPDVLRVATPVAGTITLGALSPAFIILEPGDKLVLVVTGAVAPIADLWVSGAELQGLAP